MSFELPSLNSGDSSFRPSEMKNVGQTTGKKKQEDGIQEVVLNALKMLEQSNKIAQAQNNVKTLA